MEQRRSGDVSSPQGVKENASQDFFPGSINSVDIFSCPLILWPGKEFGGFFSIYSTGGGEARYQL